jgi:threonine/homoserine/homoserine lactone efflux protein
MDGLLGFILAAFALAWSPGPATLSLAATGAAFGSRRGVAYMTGITLGMLGVMGITATSVVGVILALPGATPVVATLAAAYFVYLAYRIATAPPLADGTEQRRQPSFSGGVFLSLVNPKGYAATAALFSGFVLVLGRPGLDVLAKTIVFEAIILAANIAWLIAGGTLTRFLREPRTNRAINVTFAILLLASVAFALLR